MAKIYAQKIIKGDLNPATGQPWKLEDVPMKWREEVRKIIESI